MTIAVDGIKHMSNWKRNKQLLQTKPHARRGSSIGEPKRVAVKSKEELYEEQKEVDKLNFKGVSPPRTLFYYI